MFTSSTARRINKWAFDFAGAYIVLPFGNCATDDQESASVPGETCSRARG